MPTDAGTAKHSEGGYIGYDGGIKALGFSKIRGTILGSPSNKDHGVLVPKLGSPYSWKLQMYHRKVPSHAHPKP